MFLPSLLAALFGLLLIVGTPVLLISLFIRQAGLRRQIRDLAEENNQKFLKLQRAVGELQAKLAAAPPPPAMEKPAAAEVRHPASDTRTFPEVHVPPPIPIPPRVEVQPSPQPQPAPPVPVVEKKPEPAPVPPVAVTPPITPAAPSPAPPKPAIPPTPVEPKPAGPVAPTTPPAGKPTPPATPPPAVPHTPAPPVMPPPQPAAIPPAATRTFTPPPFSPLRTPDPKPTMKDRMRAISALEDTLGTNWFAKLGGIMVVVGITTIGLIKLQSFGASGKATVSYLVAFFLLGGGIFLEKRERYQLLGRVGIGCGWALLFGSTYGIHNFPAMRILDSLVADCVLMLIVALAMAAHTLRYKSQFVTGLSFLLGYTTIALSFSEITSASGAGADESTVYGLLAGVFLAIGLVAIVLKMGWFELEVFGILSSYLNHIYWLYKILGPNGAHGRAFPEYHASVAMLFFYWLAFRISYIVRGVKTDFEEHVSTVSALLNTLLLLGAMKFQSVDPGLAYIALLLIGALEFTFAQLPITRRRRRAFIILSLLGAALMIVAVPSHFSGNPVAYLWLVGVEVFIFAGVIFEEVVFLRVGLFTGLLVGVDLIGFNFRPLIELRSKSEALVSEAGILFAVCGVALYLNALYIGSRWKEAFRAALDNRLLAFHSYFGAFATATAAWALFANDWTALAFAAIMLALAAIGRRLESRHLQIQYALLGALVLYRTFAFNLHIESSAPHIGTRLITLPILGAIFYLTAKLAALRDDQEQRIFRGLFAFAGTALFAALIWFEVPDLWRPVLFIAFAIALSENARALRYQVLAFHAHAIALLAVFTALTADPSTIHVWHRIPLHAFGALPVAAGCYWIAKRLGTEDARHIEIARVAYTWIAAGIMVWIVEEALGDPWIAVGWIAFAVALALATRWIRYRQLAWQANVVALAAFARTYTFNLNLYGPLWRHISMRLFTVGLVIAGAYALAKIAAEALEEFKPIVRNAYTWVAAFFVGFLIFLEASDAWMAVFFLAAGIVLALVGRRWKLPHLGFQEHLFAIAAVARIFDYNYHLTSYYGNFSVRMITVSIVAAGLYAISRKATAPDAPYALPCAYLHTTAATTLLALLMWYETSAGSGWLAAFWALFAFALAAIDRRFKLDDLRWQAHGLALLTMLRAVGINMHVEETWHGVSVRLLSLSIVAVVFYAMSRLVRMPEEWRASDFHHIYSWCASLIVSLLLWHELNPLSIAVGLAAFGLVLFEYGLLRKVAQFRYQSYVAFTAAFARIFFANLAAGAPGVFLSDRMITVAPLVLIFFFVYAQLPATEENIARDRRFRFDVFVAYLGTATLAALFYFQFAPEWVVVSYATLALALFAAAWALDRRLFLEQAILGTLGTFARGMAHNLFGSSYFGQGTWQGRYSIVGISSAILLASLYFAFALRGRYAPQAGASRWKKIATALVARPEQLQFFVPVILVATMFALKMNAEWVTASWGLEGLCIVLVAYLVKEHSFRLAGYALLVLCVAKVAAMDFWRETLFERGVSVALVGGVLIVVALLHTRLKETFEHHR